MAEPSAGWRSQHNVPLPRAIDPNKFASAREPEILAITEALKKSEVGGTKYGIDGIPRHLRRRTRSHNPYKHRRRPNATPNQIKQNTLRNCLDVVADPATAASHPLFTNRKMRRRPGKLAADCLLKAVWLESAIVENQKQMEIYYNFINYGSTTPTLESPPPLGFPPPSPPRRLETHLWHAKRLAMVSTWNGWMLPEGDPGPGRGTRAFARRISTGAVIHDASYWCPVLISGRLETLLSCLKLVTDPEIVQLVNDKVGKTSSQTIGWEIEAMLHKINAFPVHALSPIKIMALPQGGGGGNSDGAAMSNDGANVINLCIWIHGAAIGEAHKALKTAVDYTNKNSNSTISSPDDRRLSLIVGNARRIEIKGAKSDEMLLNALFKHTQTTSSTSTPRLTHTLRILKPGEAALIALPDPRLSKPINLGSSTSTSLLDANASNKVDYDIFSHTYPSPLTEAAVSQARKEARHLLVIGEESQFIETLPSFSTSLQGAMHCAAIFVRGHKGLKSSSGWSIILPPGWVMPIWLALIFQGCRATGQREWRWLHTLDHRPFFPQDVPDSLAYDTFTLKQEDDGKEEDLKRPLGKSSNFTQIGQCWLGISELNIIDNKRTSAEDNRYHTEKKDTIDIFVARSESAMLKALFGVVSAPSSQSDASLATSSTRVLGRNSSLRPVSKALASRKLQWVPRNTSNPVLLRSSITLGGDLCLVEAAVTMVNKGAADEGATIYVIWKEEGQLSHGQPCYFVKSDAEEANKRYIDYSQLIRIGFITSAAPQGTGRATASIALVSAAAFWRLRSLQYCEYRRDRGTVEAWMQNPRSHVLYPVRLSLLIEERNKNNGPFTR